MKVSHAISRYLLILFMLGSYTPLAALPTGQASELIIYKGDTLQLLSLPLTSYIDSHQEKADLLDGNCSTALWRGYVALWKLIEDKLILMDVYRCGHKDESLMKNLFGTVEPVIANWFSGQLNIQHGDMIKYSHDGFSRYYEEETVITVEEGKALSTVHYVNGARPADAGISDEPDSVIAEVYKRINWSNLPNLSTESKVFIHFTLAETDTFKILKSSAPSEYTSEVQRVLDNFPTIKKFYSRDQVLTQRFICPVFFDEETRKKYAQ